MPARDDKRRTSTEDNCEWLNTASDAASIRVYVPVRSILLPLEKTEVLSATEMKESQQAKQVVWESGSLASAGNETKKSI